jgi:hypothetical protein
MEKEINTKDVIERELVMREENAIKLQVAVNNRENAIKYTGQELDLLKDFSAKGFTKLTPTYEYENTDEWLEYVKNANVDLRTAELEELIKVQAIDKEGLLEEETKIGLLRQGILLSDGKEES